MWRQGVAFFLHSFAGDAAVFQANSGADALRVADRHGHFDLALVDLNMQGMDGLSTLVGLRRRQPTLRTVMLSASESPADMSRSLAAGADGYIPKSADHVQLRLALEQVLAGQAYVPELPPGTDVSPMAPSGAGHTSGEWGLTGRQQEVLDLMSEGLSNKLIADRLGIAEKTIKIHVSAIFKALGVTNRTQAVMATRGL